MTDDPSTVVVTQWGMVLGAALAAAVLDLRSRRIPNALTLPVVLGGWAYGYLTGGWAGLGNSALACVVLALPYVVLFVFAGGGAGDAKMMGALGAWLGLRAGVVVLVAVAAVGGLIGLVSLMWHQQRGSGWRNLPAALYVFAVGLAGGRQGRALLRGEPGDQRSGGNRRPTICYGPAIFIGACIGAWVVHSWRI